jgi:hypothetical protein
MWGLSGYDIVDTQTATLICTTENKDHAVLVVSGLNTEHMIGEAIREADEEARQHGRHITN